MDLKRWEEDYRRSPVGAERVKEDFECFVGTAAVREEWEARVRRWIDVTEARCLCVDRMARLLDEGTGLFGTLSWKERERSEWRRLLEQELETQRGWSECAVELTQADGLLLQAMGRYGELCRLCQRLSAPALWATLETVYEELLALRSRFTEGLEQTVMPISRQMDRLTRSLGDYAALSEGGACSVAPLRALCGVVCNYARERMTQWKQCLLDGK